MPKLVIACALLMISTATEAETIYKMDFSAYDGKNSGKLSLQPNYDTGMQTESVTSAFVQPFDPPVGPAGLMLTLEGGHQFFDFFVSKSASVKGKDLLSVHWYGWLLTGPQTYTIGLSAGHFQDIASLVAKNGQLFVSAGGKMTQFGTYENLWTHSASIAVDFSGGYAKPKVRIMFAEKYTFKNGTKGSHSFASPWITYTAASDVSGENRFILSTQGSGFTTPAGAFAMAIGHATMDMGLNLKLPVAYPFPDPHCHSDPKNPLKIVCNGPISPK